MNNLFRFIKSRWLSICTTWLGVYPILTVIAWTLEPYLAAQPIALRSLVMSVLMVPVMVLLVMPVMQNVTDKLTNTSELDDSSLQD